jgi:hypothetical protein
MADAQHTSTQRSLALMTPDEARRCVAAIRQHLNSTRALLLDLYERKGWQALGYKSWRACVVAEFGDGQSTLYQELNAAQLEQHISAIAENSPASPLIGSIQESHLRPLAPYKHDPALVRRIWNKVLRTAPPGGITAAHVQQVIDSMIAKPGDEPGDPPPYQRPEIVRVAEIHGASRWHCAHHQRYLST